MDANWKTVVENYNDYWNFQNRYYCFIIKAPMYNYIPDTLKVNKVETTVRTDWREGDIVRDVHALWLDESIPPGQYVIEAGLISEGLNAPEKWLRLAAFSRK